MVCRDAVMTALRRCRWWVVCLLAIMMSPAPAQAAWQRLDSPNFVIVGDASDRELRNIAAKFEAFREVLGRLRGTEVATAPVPTIVIVFRNAKAFSPYTPRYEGRPKEIGGMFVPGRDINHIAFINDRADFTQRVIHHEYAHLIIQNATGDVPVWLNEGLAEVYSTFELSRDGQVALIGRPVGEHVALLHREPFLKLNELLQVNHDSRLYNEGDRRSVFYAQSWALVHMIVFGEPSRIEQLRGYMQRLSQGVPPVEAWAQAFGADSRIERELERYISQFTVKAFQEKFTERLPEFKAIARPLAPMEVQAYLGQLLLAQRRVDEAAAQLAWDGKPDQDPTAAVLSAQLAVARGDHAGAIKALTGREAPLDWLMGYHGAMALGEAIERTRDTRPEVLAAASAFFDAAARQSLFPNVTMRRAALENLGEGSPADATILAVQGARKAAPGRDDYAFVHAQLLAHRADFAAARSVVGPLLARGRSPEVRDAARSLMKWILELENLQKARAAAETTQSAEPDTPADNPPAGTAGKVQPIFRKTEPGEERVEGMLQRIECSRRGAVTFVLQTTGQAVRLPARSMETVEFITYRDDLTGNVTCGPVKEPMRVYVTSRASPQTNGAREVVAIEFLPKELQ